MEHEETITAISTQAVQEQLLFDLMEEIIEQWKGQELSFKPYKQEEDMKYQNMVILTAMDEIQEGLDESIAKMNHVLGSRYLNFQKKKAFNLKKRLLTYQDCLDEWL